MYFPVNVSVFAFVRVWKIRFETKRKQSIFYGDPQTHSRSLTKSKSVEERERKIEEEYKSTAFRTGISLSFASCTRFWVAFSFCQSHLGLFLSQCEIKSMCIVLQMMR